MVPTSPCLLRTCPTSSTSPSVTIFLNRGTGSLNNWSEYNKALKQRGRIDLWVSDDTESWWTHSERIYDGTGSSCYYTDLTILVCHEIRSIFRLPLRQTEGFIQSLFDQAGLELKCPDFSVLSKRLRELNIKTPGYKKGDAPSTS